MTFNCEHGWSFIRVDNAHESHLRHRKSVTPAFSKRALPAGILLSSRTVGAMFGPSLEHEADDLRVLHESGNINVARLSAESTLAITAITRLAVRLDSHDFEIHIDRLRCPGSFPSVTRDGKWVSDLAIDRVVANCVAACGEHPMFESHSREGFGW